MFIALIFVSQKNATYFSLTINKITSYQDRTNTEKFRRPSNSKLTFYFTNANSASPTPNALRPQPMLSRLSARCASLAAVNDFQQSIVRFVKLRKCRQGALTFTVVISINLNVSVVGCVLASLHMSFLKEKTRSMN